jgi:hypothetical protein
MVYENQKSYDQIACGAGKRGLAYRQRRPCHVLVPLFTQRFYTTPVIRDTGLESIRFSKDFVPTPAGFLLQPTKYEIRNTNDELNPCLFLFLRALPA